MTLNDLNTMQKADKYTQDGRDELIKAQEETEDKVYQIGEISQKTGLQKTANGWVQPKNGAAGSTEKKEDKQLKHSRQPDQSPEENLAAWENSAKAEARILGENQVMLQNAMGDVTFYSEGNDEAIEKAESKGFKKMSLVRPDGSVKRHQGNNPGTPVAPKSATTGQNKLAEIAKISGTYKPENLHAEVTPKGNIAIIEKKADGQTHNIMTVNPKAYHIDLADLDEEGILDRPNYEEDSAPRQLTGDTRLRLSQVTDRTYQIGEISQKTGLKKTAHGWVKPTHEEMKKTQPRKLPVNNTMTPGQQERAEEYNRWVESEAKKKQAATQNSAVSQKPAENKGMDYKENFLKELRTGNHNVKEWAYNKEYELGEKQEKLRKKQIKAKTPEEKKKIEAQMAEIGKQIDALGEATTEYKNNPDGDATTQNRTENKGMEENKYQERKKAQQVEAARQNKNFRDFYDNTGLKGRGGPEEALARNEADKEDRKQDKLKAGKRDDSMFKQNDKIEFNRAGHYINGKIEKVDKDWQGNVSLYVRGDDGKGYWVETNNVTKHQTGDRAPLTGDCKIRVKK